MFKIIKKIWDDFKEYIVLIILLLISLFFISKNESKSIGSFKSFVFGNFAIINSLVSSIFNSSNLAKENESLRLRNAELLIEVNKLREYGIVNEELRRLISLKDTSEYSLLAARIISKNLEESQGVFTINVGNNSGVRPGMPVISGEGLVGVINNVGSEYSSVKILKNNYFKMIVKNQRSRIEGILRWNGVYLTVTNLPKTADMKIGDRIITSEMSSLINLPLPVGIVTKIINPEKGWFNDLVIKPYVDFIKIENVFVLMMNQSKFYNNVELNYYKRN
jgi:rod shape-determining protein MreC